MEKPKAPTGNQAREAIDSLGGYVYQLYQSALAWMDLNDDEFLFLEVAEDYTVVARDALRGTQVKRTSGAVTINSPDIIASIDSFVELQTCNTQLEVHLRHITTSSIGRERSASSRLGDTPTLDSWRNLARIGEVTPLRSILMSSGISDRAKRYISALDDNDFRERFLRRIHFDCGALNYGLLRRQLESKVIKALRERGGTATQAKQCLNSILITLLKWTIEPIREERVVNKGELESLFESATHVNINRAQLEVQNELVNKALSAVIPKATDIIASVQLPRPIGEIQLPPAFAPRTAHIQKIISCLSEVGVAWVYGAAGVGKTFAAKLAARQVGGNWTFVNYRGFTSDQANQLLSQLADHVSSEKSMRGILLDDLECTLEPSAVDALLLLLSTCKRQDILVLVTAPRPLQSDVAFGAGLSAAIETKFDDFDEGDIAHILRSLGVDAQNWAKYIRVISGGGHPQLVIAAIQSMQRSGWNVAEFKTLNSLLVGNPEVKQVRAQTRARLLRELPDGGLRLLERLSVTSLAFKRVLALDLARMTPEIPNGGLLFEHLIGTWIDQLNGERFSLSPLLSDFAENTLTADEVKTVHFYVADSLMRNQPINPIEGDRALLSAWIGGNTDVLLRLCLSLLGSDNCDLELITPHFQFLRLLRTDKPAYPDDENVSQIIRGAQLLILAHSDEGATSFLAAVECFERERTFTRQAGKPDLSLVVYAKMLLSTPSFGAIPQFWQAVEKFDEFFSAPDGSIPEELLAGFSEGTDAPTTVGFMFLNQIRQIRKIQELLPVFEFLSRCDAGLRSRIFRILDDPNRIVDADMYVTGAWLAEHDAETMDPENHVEIFRQLEEFAIGWPRQDIAVACCKYQAIIADEYGKDKEAALSILERGLDKYGATNSELVRAKAKVYYRAEDHQASLELAGNLIEGGASLSHVEKAFLGRDAAISAEKQGDFQTARRYYLFGAEAAKSSEHADMRPMYLGLRADAALAAWHDGDRAVCLVDLVGVLAEIDELDPKSSLRAAHSHAIIRHVLLWLDQESSGEERVIADGTSPQIYPGIVSNPEPHSEIGERFLPIMEVSWYLLAKIECHCLLDLGIADNIDAHLKGEPVYIGQSLLMYARLEKAIRTANIELFASELENLVAFSTFLARDPSNRSKCDLETPTYGKIPRPSSEEISGQIDMAEREILTFAIRCLFQADATVLVSLCSLQNDWNGFAIRAEFSKALAGSGEGTDFNLALATIVNQLERDINGADMLTPIQVFDLSMKVLQLAKVTVSGEATRLRLYEWLSKKWVFIWSQQRFLLKNSALHERAIMNAFSEGSGLNNKIMTILDAVLPTLGISNEQEIRGHLVKLRDS
ncbi:AAA family ATPase [Ochrobactrum quorumnocens]|uniref:AAA family ATPase n=1 Tax=Ochrobactrum quorumnocens TaxID=271865 RepID=UPI003BA0F80D